MKVLRVSQDTEGIARVVRSMAAKAPLTPEAQPYVAWILHLIRLRRLVEANPALAGELSWAESEGLALVDDVMNEHERGGRTCPRCQSATKSLYSCEKCGMRLAA